MTNAFASLAEFTDENHTRLWEHFNTLRSAGIAAEASLAAETIRSIKTADQFHTDNTSDFRDDSHLRATLKPGWWAVDGTLYYASSSSSTTNKKFMLAGPAWFRNGITALAQGATSDIGNLTASSAVAGSVWAGTPAGTIVTARYSAGLRMDTAGEVRLRWGKVAATALQTVVYAGSWLEFKFMRPL